MNDVIEKRNAMIDEMVRESFGKVCEKGRRVNLLAEAMVEESRAFVKVHGPLKVGKRVKVGNDAWTIDTENNVILIYLAEKIKEVKDLERLVGRAAMMYDYRERVYTKKDKLLGDLCPINFDIRLVLLGDVDDTGEGLREEMKNFETGKFSEMIYVRTVEAYPRFSEACQVDEHRWLTCTVMPFFDMARYQFANLNHQYDKPLPLCYADEMAFECLLAKEEYYR